MRRKVARHRDDRATLLRLFLGLGKIICNSYIRQSLIAEVEGEWESPEHIQSRSYRKASC